MPRRNIKLETKVESLSILDEKGNVDESLDPGLDGDMLLSMHRLMLFTRRFDERLLALQRQGRIGTYAPVRGHEATQVGAVLAIKPSDWMVQSYREPGACFHRGWPVQDLIKFWGGFEEGCRVPDGVNDTPIAVPVASQFPHLMGIAWAMQMKGTEEVAIGFVGDGGTSEGDFHEALTFAGVFKVPAVFIIVNNQWAISVPRERQSACKTLAQKAVGYGMDGVQVDGNDVLAVHVAVKEAVDKARSGGGPTLIESVTYRLIMHTTADDPKKYRDEEEVKKWERRDAIPRFEKYLRGKGVLDDRALDEMESDIKETLAKGVKTYEQQVASVNMLDCFDYTYREMPAELEQQRAEFKAALEAEGVEVGD